MSHDSVMIYEEFKRQLGKAGLTARDFAVLIRLNANSITNYASLGEVPSHLAVIVTLMGEMAENRLDFRLPLSRIHLAANKPRGKGAKGRFGGTRQLDLQLPTERTNTP